MKLRPSIALNDFSGSARNVTARKVGERTFLSNRAKHFRTKTESQSETRCRFTSTTRRFARITEPQRQAWNSLANNLGIFSTSTGQVSLTGHNFFVAINSYRKICGKPLTDEG